MELGSKAPLEDLGLNRKKMLYLLRRKKRKLAIDIFIDRGRGACLRSLIMALLFWMKREAGSFLLRVKGLGLNTGPGRPLKF